MSYSEKVIGHYQNLRKIGTLNKLNPNVGTILVGAPESLVNHISLALNEFSNIHFVGDTLSTREIISGSHVIYDY